MTEDEVWRSAEAMHQIMETLNTMEVPPRRSEFRRLRATCRRVGATVSVNEEGKLVFRLPGGPTVTLKDILVEEGPVH